MSFRDAFASYTRSLARHVRVTERILIFQAPSPLLYQTQTRNTPIVVSSDSLPHSRPAMISPFLLPTRSASPSIFLPPPPLPPFSLVRVGRKRRRWRLITTQSPLPVRPTPTRSEKGSNRLLPPRGIHYRCTGIAKPTIFILDSAEKKASLSPPSTLFSASFLQITGGPTDRSTTGIRGIHRENGADSTLRTDRRTHRSYLRIKRPGQRAISRTRHWPECGSSGYPRPDTLTILLATRRSSFRSPVKFRPDVHLSPTRKNTNWIERSTDRNGDDYWIERKGTKARN